MRTKEIAIYLLSLLSVIANIFAAFAFALLAVAGYFADTSPRENRIYLVSGALLSLFCGYSAAVVLRMTIRRCITRFAFLSFCIGSALAGSLIVGLFLLTRQLALGEVIVFISPMVLTMASMAVYGLFHVDSMDDA